jgi:hypothetical protein
MGKSWLCAVNSSSAWHIGLSGGAPDSVRCTRLVNGEAAGVGNRRSCTAIIHQTIRWCTGLSGEWSATNSPLSRNGKDDVAIIHRSALDCPVSQRSVTPQVLPKALTPYLHLWLVSHVFKWRRRSTKTLETMGLTKEGSWQKHYPNILCNGHLGQKRIKP